MYLSNLKTFFQNNSRFDSLTFSLVDPKTEKALTLVHGKKPSLKF